MTTPNRQAPPRSTAQEALARAIRDTGGTQAKFAEVIGTTQSLVGYWLNKSRRGVPAEWVIKIETATGVSRHELRPDLYPLPPTVSAAPLREADAFPALAACDRSGAATR